MAARMPRQPGATTMLLRSLRVVGHVPAKDELPKAEHHAVGEVQVAALPLPLLVLRGGWGAG